MSQHKARQEDGEVTDIERDEDPNVSPPVRVLDVERELQELVRGPEQAEQVRRCRVGVCEIAIGVGHVWTHVLRTSHSNRWVDVRIFNIRTGDLLSTEP